MVADAISAPASAIGARDAAEPMADDPQTLMTRLRTVDESVAVADRARADSLAHTVRTAIDRYRDSARAIADGYRSFPPAPDRSLRIVHYVHRARSAAESRRIDPTRPGALLYERMPDGALRLVGAMFTAPVGASSSELDRRVPLSVTQWHLHQNVCVPQPLWDKAAWARRAPDGRPVFGTGSATVTPTACTAERGQFLPTVFGWMAHVHVFATDPADVWNAMYGHDMPHRHGHGAGHDHAMPPGDPARAYER